MPKISHPFEWVFFATNRDHIRRWNRFAQANTAEHGQTSRSDRDMLVASRRSPHPLEVTMRNPKSPQGKGPGTEAPPKGGRAWARVVQFAIARGLPVAPPPEAEKSDGTALSSAKPALKRVRKGTVKTRAKARSK
jgi:hypothetical protein